MRFTLSPERPLVVVAHGAAGEPAPGMGQLHPFPAEQVLANGAELLREEIQRRCPGAAVEIRRGAGTGGDGEAAPQEAGAVVHICLKSGGLARELGLSAVGPEGFSIRVRSEPEPAVYLAGDDPSGALYATCELLDRMECRGAEVSVPDEAADQSPDCVVRCVTSAGRAGGMVMAGEEGLERAVRTLAHYARYRVNLMTITASKGGWPGDLTPLATFAGFPPLHDPARDDEVRMRRERLGRFIRAAHGWGIRVVLYTTEFNFQEELPERCPEMIGRFPETWAAGRSNYMKAPICMSRDTTWEYMDAKVGEVVEELPELDGIEFWMAEAPSEVISCQCERCAPMSRTDRVRLFIERVTESVRRRRPELPVHIRTFLSAHGAREVETFLPLKGELPEGVRIVLKGQFGDMAYLNDPHPLAGRIQNGEELVELDLGGEYRGGGMGTMISCIPGYLAERMRGYYGKGVRRFAGRHADHTWPEKDLIFINDLAFTRLAWDMDTDVEALWRRWAEEKFGARALPEIVDLLELTDDLVRKTLYARGVCINRHYYVFPDSVSSFLYMMTDLSASMIDGGYERITPSEETIRAVIEEKEQGVELAAEMLGRLRSLEGRLEKGLFERLLVLMERAERVARVMRHLAEAVFRYLLYVRTLSELQRDAMRPVIRRAVDRCEEEIDRAMREEPERSVRDEQVIWSLRRVVDYHRPRRLCEEILGGLVFRVSVSSNYEVKVQPLTVGHPNTYEEHRRLLKDIYFMRQDQ